MNQKSENERELMRDDLPQWRIDLLPTQIADSRRELEDYDKTLKALRGQLKEAIRDGDNYMQIRREG